MGHWGAERRLREGREVLSKWRDFATMNLERYTERCKGFLQSAQTLALRSNHQQLSPLHLLKVLLDDRSDAAGLAYDALDQARTRRTDVLLIDTAGRLQNRSDLMAELTKIIRVLKKVDDSAPHDCILVLDATVGQNAHSQVETFRSIVNVTGLVMTKLDGSAKGGVVVALADRFGLPVHAVGVGESLEDMRPFDPRAFARSLLGLADE